MGIDADPRADPKLECVEDDLLKFHGRSTAHRLCDGSLTGGRNKQTISHGMCWKVRLHELHGFERTVANIT